MLSLYNKKTLRSYTISYKLFFILEQFRKQSYSLEHLIEEFNVRNIDLSDFYHFIEKDEFFDLLVMANNFKGPFVKYKISKDLSSYTAYSPERVDFLITKHCNLACKHCLKVLLLLLKWKELVRLIQIEFCPNLKLQISNFKNYRRRTFFSPWYW